MSKLLISSCIDRTGERYFHMVVWWWVGILGYIIALATMSTGGRYFSLFLMTLAPCGTSAEYHVCLSPETYRIGTALVLNWVSNVIPRPLAKRLVAMGMVNGVGCLGVMCVSRPWSLGAVSQERC